VKVVLLLLGLLLGPIVGTAPDSVSTPAPSAGPADRASGQATSFRRHLLTGDDTALTFNGDHRRLVMTARGAGPDWNRREVFHAVDARPVRRQTTCATWKAQSGTMLQEGLAARIRAGKGRVRAITLTKNTIFDVNWIFNILTWDTDRKGDIWRTVGQFNMAEALVDPDGNLRPLPWRVCLRTIGRSVSFKVWLPRSMTEPSWSSRVYARQAVLPSAFRAPGKPGWYVGHVPDGGRLVYRKLTTG
jgi:hypothetical protein